MDPVDHLLSVLGVGAEVLLLLAGLHHGHPLQASGVLDDDLLLLALRSFSGL